MKEWWSEIVPPLQLEKYKISNLKSAAETRLRKSQHFFQGGFQTLEVEVGFKKIFMSMQ